MAGYHSVKQGDYLALIAKRHGFGDDRAIYEDTENSEFRRKRPNRNQIYPGDRVYIPDKQPREVAGDAGKRHVFRAKKRGEMVRIALTDHQGEKLKGLKYVLEVGGRAVEGTVGESGVIEQKLPRKALGEDATLILKELGLAWRLKIGHLDPVEDGADGTPVVSGAQARLNNLGFHCGKVDGVMGPRTQAAIKRFQRTVMGRRSPDGMLDEDTRAALVQRYGS